MLKWIIDPELKKKTDGVSFCFYKDGSEFANPL